MSFAPAQDGHAGHDHKHADDAAKPKCPVMDEPVDLFVSTATDAGPVYFCCSDCIGKYNADRAKYAAAVTAQRKALEPLPKVQVTCPVTGQPVDGKVSIDDEGKKVYFASQEAADKFKAEPAKYKAKLLNSYSFQTVCPVSGKAIDAKSFVTLKGGQKVYFCCDRCDEKFLEKPAEYLTKLESQGFHLAASQAVVKK